MEIGGNGNRGNGNGGNEDGGNRNGGNGNGGNVNGNGKGGEYVYNFRGFMPARECLYQEMETELWNLNSALTWWNSHKRTIGNEAAYAMSWAE
ncbi:hypothetical protein Tco_0501345, partial [Tanacetum coccineum]